MVSLMLMLKRLERGGAAHSGALDGQILEDSRRRVREILDDAEVTLCVLEDAGWPPTRSRPSS
jgi:hypothetical protein